MGGGYSLQAALLLSDLSACVICYGRLPADDSTLAPLEASVYGIFGAEDRGIPAASVTSFQERARKLGKNVTLEVYDGVGHAFMNPNNAQGYSEPAASRAWTAILEFLDRTLEPGK
jgi:carboxymethylenebutenolidase